MSFDQSYFLLLLSLALLLIAPGLRRTESRLSRVLALYGIFAYATHAFMLVVLQPAPTRSSSFAIQQLTLPSYSQALAPVLTYVTLGNVACFAGLLLGQKIFRTSTQRDDPQEARFEGRALRTALILYCGSALVRLAALETGLPIGARYVALAQGIGPGMLCLAVLRHDWRRSSLQIRWLVYGALLFEALYGVAIASKTPLLVALFIIYLDPHRGRLRYREFLVSVSGVILAFSVVQQSKAGYSTDPNASSNLFVRVFYAISARLDGLYAMTRAYQAPPNSYLTLHDFILRSFTSVIPGVLQVSPKILAGQNWGVLVYHSTTGTSYAESLSAEGYAEYGSVGVVAWGVVGGVFAALMLSMVVSRSNFLAGVGCTVVASVCLIERGLLGRLEQVSVGLEVAVIFWAALWFVKARRGRVRPNGYSISETCLP